MELARVRGCLLHLALSICIVHWVRQERDANNRKACSVTYLIVSAGVDRVYLVLGCRTPHSQMAGLICELSAVSVDRIKHTVLQHKLKGQDNATRMQNVSCSVTGKISLYVIVQSLVFQLQC